MDTTRIVTFSNGGRPILQKDLETGVYYAKVRDSFSLTPGDKHQVVVSQNRRYGGGKIVGESHDNWSMAATWLISGASPDNTLTNLSTFLAQLETIPAGDRFIQWQPDGASYPVFFEIRGTAKWDPKYKWVEFNGAQCIQVEVSFPIAPLARGHAMDIGEDFSPKGSVVYTNLLANPSAEVDVSSASSSGTAVLSRITSDSVSGSACYECVVTALVGTTQATSVGAGPNGLGTGGAPVTPGTTYAARLSVKMVSASGGTVSLVKGTVRWHDASGATISEPDLSQQNTPANGQWYSLSGVVVAPAGAAYASVRAYVSLSVTGMTFTYRADAFMLVASNTVPAYFDGSTEGGNWTGAAGVSSSQLYSDSALNDFTTDIGAKSNLASASSALRAVANLTTENRLLHTARGYRYGDVECTIKVTPGTTITNFKAGRVFNYIDANNFLEVYVDDNGTNSRLRLDVIVGGVRTNRFSGNLASRISAGNAFWVRGRIEGNKVTAVATLTNPLDNPGVSAGGQGATYSLTTAEAAAVGATTVGKTGFSWTPQDAAATLTNYEDLPYTYSVANSLAWSLAGNIPGDAPALGGLLVQQNGVTRYSWGALGWMPTAPAPSNECWNGDFEEDANGWSVAAVTNMNGAATSITRQTTGVLKYGLGVGEITCPATAGTGASFKMYRRFRQGKTYTAEVWVYSAAAVTSVSVRVGNAAANDVATSTGVALTAGYQKISVTWTPSSERMDAHVAVIINAATATVFRIDGVEVYAGTVAPSWHGHSEGRGAYAPFGQVQAEACDTGDLANFAITADANASDGTALAWSSIGGSATATATWFLDPNLLSADDFTGQDLQVEVYARANVGTTLTACTAVLSARDEFGTQQSARYTAEFGLNGKSLLAAPPNAYRLYRLGTVTFNVDRNNPKRWKLRLDVTAAGNGTSTLSLDDLFFLPVRRRAANPTSKAYSVTGYPHFFGFTGAITTSLIKQINSDLSATVRNGSYPPHPSPGLGGSVLEFPPGPLDAALCIDNGVPDDTTSVSSSAPTSYSDILGMNFKAHLSVIPRWTLARDA